MGVPTEAPISTITLGTIITTTLITMARIPTIHQAVNASSVLASTSNRITTTLTIISTITFTTTDATDVTVRATLSRLKEITSKILLGLKNTMAKSALKIKRLRGPSPPSGKNVVYGGCTSRFGGPAPDTEFRDLAVSK